MSGKKLERSLYKMSAQRDSRPSFHAIHLGRVFAFVTGFGDMELIDWSDHSIGILLVKNDTS